MKKLICDRCKRSVIRLSIITENGQKTRLCEPCYNLFNEEGLEVPEMIILRDKQVTLMGSYTDNTPRYIVSVPKDRKEDFSLHKSYDIWFKVRK